MSRLMWGGVGDRFYEAGVDRGVLYIDGVASAWNGLVSVNESPTGGESKPYYIDGVKYLNRNANEEYVATIEAYTYPDAFGLCDGSVQVKNGLFATQQPRKSFSLAYRSKIGNDQQGTDYGYKIHLVYDAKAEPSSQTHATIDDSVDPLNFSWQITTRPPIVQGRKPTSHFVIDSRKTPLGLLLEIENVLYGSDLAEPRLPSVSELLFIFDSYASGILDAGLVGMAYFNEFSNSNPPTETQTATIDGGTP